MKISFDPQADAAYVTLGESIGAGEAVQQVSLIDTPNGETQVTIDFDSEGRILGFEILAASQGLRKETLEASAAE